MAKPLSRMSRRELVGVTSDRYRAGSSAEKRIILTEFVALTGYHRKHAIRLLNQTAVLRTPTRQRGERRIYNDAVRDALVVLWEAVDRVCGKRLKPLIGILIPALERHGHLRLDTGVRTQVLAVSPATIDRLLSPIRAAARGGPARHHPPTSSIRRKVPIRTFADWHTPVPGFVEADLVAHSGGDPSGSFLQTLVLTDVASGWTECVALIVQDGALIVEALTRLRATLPFRLSGLDTDNGSVFLNETVLAFCTTHGIEFTRSRPYRKNDQAWVEQKNGAVVRRFVGHRRLEGIAAAEALTRLYAATRLFVNVFQPSFKLAETSREGARVSKRYHAPETPCARLLTSDAIPDAVKDRLRGLTVTLDPLRLLDEIRTMQHHVACLGADASPTALPPRSADLDLFLRGLSTAWRDGEVRLESRDVVEIRRGC